MAKWTIQVVWNEEAAAELEAWMVRGRELGLDMTATRMGGERRPSASAGIRMALRRAAACRCEERAESLPVAPTNPLRGMREAAGLTQMQMAKAMGISRGQWANVEKAGAATEAMVERAQAALGRRAA